MIAFHPRLPGLVGRTDLLVHYRLALIERDQVFELIPVRGQERLPM